MQPIIINDWCVGWLLANRFDTVLCNGGVASCLTFEIAKTVREQRAEASKPLPMSTSG